MYEYALKIYAAGREKRRFTGRDKAGGSAAAVRSAMRRFPSRSASARRPHRSPGGFDR